MAEHTTCHALVTYEMVEAAAVALGEFIVAVEENALSGGGHATCVEGARRILSTGLAGRAVLELPTPDTVDHDGDPVWHTAVGDVVGYGDADGFGSVENIGPARLAADPDRAEQYGLALIAAAHEARQRAKSSRDGA